MFPLYWWSLDLDPQRRSLAEQWVRRFTAILAAPPFGVACDLQPIDPRLASLLTPALAEEDVSDVAITGSELLFDERATPSSGKAIALPKWVVFCPEHHVLVAKLRASAPHALWGAAVGKCFALVNHFEPTVVWHELFHLFGAEDCYDERNPDEDSVPCCGHTNCLMQYAPTLEKTGDPPFLCSGNIDRVRKYSSSTEAG